MPGINFRSIILSVLEADERIWFQNEEGEKELNQTLLLDLVEKIDDKIINLLLQEEVLREKFFAKISPNPPRPASQSTPSQIKYGRDKSPQEGNILYVFKMNDFRFFMEENKIDNSYTAYKNRIGLTDGKKFLKDSNDIVLNWPYKDCILEGGQSNEEGTDTEVIMNDKLMNYELKKVKRKEIFFNSVLAPDEIDRLLDPKALVNWKRFTDNGELSMMNYELKRRKDGTIAENMIIKGNNLLAMHSLKKQFAGKVKLIYIDPPYNTGNDGFKYNDNFNHSTWLTFMKNRLEVARELLRDDGVIFVQCDDNEQAYLKVLMDEVFGRENFVNNFVWQKKSSGSQHSKHVLDFHEYVTVFSRKISNLSGFKVTRSEKQKESFKLKDEYISSRGKYLLSPLKSWLDYRKTLIYDIECPDGTFVKTQWVCGKDTFEKLKADNRIVFKKSNKEEWSVYKKQYENDRDGEVKPASLLLDDGQNMQATKELSDLFNSKVFSNPKPEKLLMKLIEMSTDPGDIILDYHLGSGTTAAVAHKMGRQYIGIEQMDYVETIAVERLKKVIGQSTSPAKAGTPQEENSRKLTAKEKQNLQEILEKIKNSNNSLG
jgi:adenine-specific DNA-methyltransferase